MPPRNQDTKVCVDLYQKTEMEYQIFAQTCTKKLLRVVHTLLLPRMPHPRTQGLPAQNVHNQGGIVTQTVINSVNPVLYDPLYN